ncbi:glucokinase [Pseudoxanthomonas broegbernensis]|uniref:Glucokinase n=1 Tax=Pseudoxanthomonas broegbernensis TaxID=83619 RepID=A0A7V8GKJ8_9GAMM|nr:glucokinase [Pseudoxanthomonas broegbernensis]KAF1685182.1 glucokinase [Pseudoxanthomonas broegbernensis]MBB6065316.1 glucokinase [Pseudoxanthomonas broegbernensis]
MSRSDRISQPFIAADVGGTHVRIGLVRPGANGDAPLSMLAYSKFRCADYASLSDIVRAFLSGLGAQPARVAVIASAGYPLADGSVIAANLPWRLSPAQVREDTGLEAVHLVNDFEAVAHAVPHLGASEVLRLSGPALGAPGPLLVLGPGTGLGAAVWIPTAGRPAVLATEAGQAALAATTELEVELLRQMLREHSHVPIEHALSGPGLLNLYRALCALRAVRPEYAAPGEITAAAIDGRDAIARECLHVFCGLLGSVVGDMALFYGAQGVYLAGGILPRIRQFLLDSAFVARFLDKGPMREALERVPVKLVEHGQLGVVGAANWYLGGPSREK